MKYTCTGTLPFNFTVWNYASSQNVFPPNSFSGYGGSAIKLTSSRSVVVITLASHEKGPQFDTGREHNRIVLIPCTT